MCTAAFSLHLGKVFIKIQCNLKFYLLNSTNPYHPTWGEERLKNGSREEKRFLFLKFASDKVTSVRSGCVPLAQLSTLLLLPSLIHS